ncbi:MAG: CDP-alcohol phosphatidyltransferase family protein [Syntrophobacteria bacterium]
MIWRQALIFPDPEREWAWAEEPLVGLPVVVRVLVTLGRAGIQQVIFPKGAEKLRPCVEYWRAKKDFPQLLWDDGKLEHDPPGSPFLAVRGGVLFGPDLLHRFQEQLRGSATGKACLPCSDSLPVLISLPLKEEGSFLWNNSTFAELCSRSRGPAFIISGDIFCRSTKELIQPGNDRELLATAGKPTDRWHVQWVRGWSFPALRWLARAGVTPNEITWIGFVVGVTACLFIARGTYWSGILGAVLLYISWVLDCMDGTLARLTFSQSHFGQMLDTVLGHLTNLFIFSGLIWAVYGGKSLWKAGVYAFFILGGITVAYRVSRMPERVRTRKTGPPAQERLQRFLDKINHRDYAVWIFLLALVDGFKVFLWLSVVGIQVYWMLSLWLRRKCS